jgi:predicted DNA-binding transcriptional regulator AlpA
MQNSHRQRRTHEGFHFYTIMEKIMDVPQPLLDLGYDAAMTARLFAVFKDTVEDAIKKALADCPISSSSPGTELKTKDKLKAADLRMALLIGKLPEDSGLLIDAKAFANLLSISSRTLSRLIDLKAVPQPVHLGRLIRWRLAEVLEWIEADCPPQKSWSSKSVGTLDRRKK